jgi:hypothetical protein
MMLTLEDRHTAVSTGSLNAADEYELIPTHSAPWSREKVLNGKIWKKITLEEYEAFVSTQQTKSMTTTAGNRKRQMPQTYQDF